MNIEISDYPNGGFFVCFPMERDEQRVQRVFSTVLADLIYKNYLPKPTRIFVCDKTEDFYFLIEPKKPRFSLLEDIKIAIDKALEK